MHNCFICDNPFEKGVGICCSRQCHNKRINTRSRDNDKHVLAKQAKIREYEDNPAHCVKCDTPLSWDQRNNRFCSDSCRATIVNLTRDPGCRIKQGNSLKHTLSLKEDKKKLKYPYSRVTFRICFVCDNTFRAQKGKTKYCSDTCKSASSNKHYRRACKFKISKTLYPELFDEKLLKEHGWYRAANHKHGYNPKGATWDHLLRVENGFKLGVDPAIISHPANAEMVSWEVNISRKKSSITLTELLLRIENWKK